MSTKSLRVLHSRYVLITLLCKVNFIEIGLVVFAKFGFNISDECLECFRKVMSIESSLLERKKKVFTFQNISFFT